MNFVLSLFSIRLIRILVFMLQQVEYQARPFLGWLARLMKGNKRLESAQTRKDLVLTRRAKLLVYLCYAFMLSYLLGVFYFGFYIHYIFFAALLFAPFGLILLLVLVSWAAKKLIIDREVELQRSSTQKVLRSHSAVKIVVAGSFGKSSFKSFLETLIGAEKKTAVTPGNNNTSTAHFRFAHKLNGNEEVLIFELGEESPGDIDRFLEVVPADIAVIVGVAPNHLDNFEHGYEQLIAEFTGIKEKVDSVYVSAQDELSGVGEVFSSEGVADWKVTDAVQTIEGLGISVEAAGVKILLKTKLIGEHLIGPVVLAAYISHRLGVSLEDITKSATQLKPFEHRMQPISINGGYIIDDSYNGNIEGLEAGIDLLDSLDFKKKIYVTPGLVEQGAMTSVVHERLADKIFGSKIDQLYLMANSATKIVANRLEQYGYKKSLVLVDDPKAFYDTIGHLVAKDTLLMMQNDWTDNYN